MPPLFFIGSTILDFIKITYLVFSIFWIYVTERLTYKIVPIFFKKHILEMLEIEKQISEYQELMILALAAKDKEAFKGLNQIADDLYWKVFFRKLIIFSTSFFLLLSPYVFLSSYFLKSKMPNIIGLTFVLAIIYFMFKTVMQYVMNVINTRKEYLKTKREH